MPEHAHLLIWPTTLTYDVSQILNSIKQSVSKRALLHVRREVPKFLPRMADCRPNGEIHYRFWQRGGGYDRNVIEPAAAHEHVEYFHNNPVRRELCATPEDWFWSSAADYAGIRVGPLALNRESLPNVVG
jgi:putative transposase